MHLRCARARQRRGGAAHQGGTRGDPQLRRPAAAAGCSSSAARSFGKNGLADTPIDEVLPLQLSASADALVTGSSSRGMNLVSLTPAGESHPVMQLGSSRDDTRKKWEAAPALAFVAPLGGPRPGATVLAVAAGAGGTPHALVAVQRYGEGRAMIFAGEAAWRWRMLLPASDRLYDTFWRQALRWLALPAADRVALAPAGDRLALENRCRIGVSVRTPEFEPQPGPRWTCSSLIRAGGRTSAARARDERRGDYVARFTPDQSGVYRMSAEARHGGGTAEFFDYGAAGRRGRSRDGRPAVEPGGARTARARVRRPCDRPERRCAVRALQDALRAGVPAARLSVTHDLWNNGVSFAIVVSLLAAEWILRRRWGADGRGSRATCRCTCHVRGITCAGTCHVRRATCDLHVRGSCLLRVTRAVRVARFGGGAGALCGHRVGRDGRAGVLSAIPRLVPRSPLDSRRQSALRSGSGHRAVGDCRTRERRDRRKRAACACGDRPHDVA